MNRDEQSHTLPEAGISKELAEELCIDWRENALLYEEFHGTGDSEEKEGNR